MHRIVYSAPEAVFSAALAYSARLGILLANRDPVGYEAAEMPLIPTV